VKIVVCIKRVPDTEARLRIAADAKAIDTDGIKSVISPYDEFAIESALRLAEGAGAGEVVVLSAGAGAAAEQLRAALAMGAHRAMLLKSPVGQDGLAVAGMLADQLRDQAADLVLFGMKAADDEQQQVGPMVAELLNLPCVTAVSAYEIEGQNLVCHREIDGGTEIVETPLPAVVTITKGAFEPRYPSLKGIMAAKRKPLEEIDVPAGESRVEVLELSLPPDRPPGRIVGQGPDAVPELVRLLREDAKVL
jgi:electron transfer flavoprotein beta subunit